MFQVEKAKIDQVIQNGNTQLSKTEQKWYEPKEDRNEVKSRDTVQRQVSVPGKQEEQSDLSNSVFHNFKFKQGLIGSIEEYQKMTKE